MSAAKGNKYAQKYTDQMIEDLCESIISFAEEDETVHFISWARRQKKSPSWINETAKDYPKLQDAYKMAQELMAEKLVKASIYGHPTNNKFNPTYAMEWKSVYSQLWRDYLKYKADIQKEQPKEPQNQAAFNEWAIQQKKESN